MGEVDYVARVQRCTQSLHYSGKYDVVLVGLKSRDGKHTPKFDFSVELIRLFSRRMSFPGVVALRVMEAYARFTLKLWQANADIYVAHDVMVLVVARLIAVIRNTKVIYNSDELEPCRNTHERSVLSRLVTRCRALCERRLAPGADLLIQADYSRADWLKTYLNVRNVEAIRNLPATIHVTDRNKIREVLNLDKDAFLVLYQGMQSRGRGLEITLDAIAELRDRRIHFVILGPSSVEYRSELRRLSERLGISENVWILPAVPYRELLHWSASADVLVALIENTCKSYYLAAPNKFYEAMMVGVPYIASNHPEMQMVHARFPAGLLVPPNERDAIVRAIVRLRDDREFYRNACREAKRAVEDEYCWEKEEIRWLKMVGEIKT
jgi:glycosyltransferase involved in cell wall biosynthesis